MNAKEYDSPHARNPDRRSQNKRALLAAALLGFCVFSWAVILWHQPTWPAVIAVALEATLVAVFCRWLLRKN